MSKAVYFPENSYYNTHYQVCCETLFVKVSQIVQNKFLNKGDLKMLHSSISSNSVHSFTVKVSETDKFIVDVDGFKHFKRLESEIFALSQDPETATSAHNAAKLLQLTKDYNKMKSLFWIELPNSEIVKISNAVEVDGVLTSLKTEIAEIRKIKEQLKIQTKQQRAELKTKLKLCQNKEEKQTVKAEISEKTEQAKTELQQMRNRALLFKRCKKTQERRTLSSVLKTIRHAEMFKTDVKPLVQMLEKNPVLILELAMNESIQTKTFDKNYVKWIIDQSIASGNVLSVEQAEIISENAVLKTAYNYGVSLNERFSNDCTFKFLCEHYPSVFGQFGSALQIRWTKATREFYDSTARLTYAGLRKLVETKQMRLGLAMFNQGQFDFKAMERSFMAMLQSEKAVPEGLNAIGIFNNEQLKDFAMKISSEYQAHWTIYTGLEIFLQRFGTSNEFDITTDSNLMKAIEMINSWK